MWQNYACVTNIQEAVEILGEQGEKARIVAGATDLILELERGVRKGIETLVDITRVPGLARIWLDEDDVIHLGPMATHSHCVASPVIVQRAFPLAQAAIEVGAPQIRNRGTVAGNLITASPANDTITPLMALGARLTLASKAGERVIALEQFYQGVRKTVMRPDEILVDISFPALQANQRGAYLKLGLRRAQAISVVNAAVVLTFESAVEGQAAGQKISQAVVTLGAVAPVIIHAKAAEEFLAGKTLSVEVMEQAAKLAMQAAQPISDVRSSREYRQEMARVCVLRCLRLIESGAGQDSFPADPVLLWGTSHSQGDLPAQARPTFHVEGTPLTMQINGKSYTFESGQGKTLLRLLREEGNLIGTKEGCAEGECGACTVFLDGVAVMACLVPAVRAHGAQIVTVEGLAPEGSLHPVQQAFIDEGAVQCGYCTPGFLMSAAKLLEERPNPSRSQIEQAITGNLCRCTGYYKIVSAIEKAARREIIHDEI